MSQRPQLWMLVGGNGSGKTTFYAKFLKPFGIHFINADLIAKELAPDKPETVSYEAAQIAEQIRLDFLQEKISFCFATVFSHPSKLEFVKKARALGYDVIMVFIHLDNAQLNIARITQRVAEGGHFVPDDKVSSRIQRLKQNVKAAIFHVDRFVAIDNSYRDTAFIKQLEFKQGVLNYRCEDLELWAEEFMINESNAQVCKS